MLMHRQIQYKPQDFLFPKYHMHAGEKKRINNPYFHELVVYGSLYSQAPVAQLAPVPELETGFD